LEFFYNWKSVNFLTEMAVFGVCIKKRTKTDI